MDGRRVPLHVYMHIERNLAMAAAGGWLRLSSSEHYLTSLIGLHKAEKKRAEIAKINKQFIWTL